MVTNPIAVGDRVVVEPEGQEGNGVIVEIGERDNYLIRKSVHKAGQSHILAANLDQVVIIASLKMPKTSFGFIDRILVSAEAFQINAVVIFNKSDLLTEEEEEFAQSLAEMYSHIGYRSFLSSIPKEKNLDTLALILEGKTSLICGHSGVGKSSLINTLFPQIHLKTQEISSFANKGKHTTTFAEMFSLGRGGYVIDTPGIKELGLVEMEGENLSLYFPEMKPYISQCRFYNCTHQHEPGCAVIQALDEGKLPLTRYESYLSLMEDEDNRR